MACERRGCQVAVSVLSLRVVDAERHRDSRADEHKVHSHP
jgi:hypothetical protein